MKTDVISVSSRGNRMESALLQADKVAAYERKLLEEALSKHGGNQSAAGRELGISPRMMCYKLKKAGIES